MRIINNVVIKGDTVEPSQINVDITSVSESTENLSAYDYFMSEEDLDLIKNTPLPFKFERQIEGEGTVEFVFEKRFLLLATMTYGGYYSIKGTEYNNIPFLALNVVKTKITFIGVVY